VHPFKPFFGGLFACFVLCMFKREHDFHDSHLFKKNLSAKHRNAWDFAVPLHIRKAQASSLEVQLGDAI